MVAADVQSYALVCMTCCEELTPSASITVYWDWIGSACSGTSYIGWAHSLQFLTSTSGFISYTTSRLTHSSNTNSAEEHDSRQQKEIEVSHPVSADMSSGTAVACQQQLLAPKDMSSLNARQPWMLPTRAERPILPPTAQLATGDGLNSAGCTSGRCEVGLPPVRELSRTCNDALLVPGHATAAHTISNAHD